MRRLACVSLALLGLLFAAAKAPAGAGIPSPEGWTLAILAGDAPAPLELWDAARWREPLTTLYAKRGFAPLWFVRGRLTRAGTALIEQLRDVESRGLLATDYEGERLAGLVAQLGADSQNLEALVSLDVALSMVAARLASDLRTGRIDPSEVGYDLDVQRRVFDAAAAVGALATAPDVAAAVDALEPELRHYVLLKRSLARYRAFTSDPELTHLTPVVRSQIRPGERYVGAPALRRLLSTLGDLREPPTAQDRDESMMDPALVTALRHFQLRHGLEPDGALGRTSFRALTTPLSARVQQIVLSLERIRWLPPKLDSAPIIVNIPQFRLFAFRTTEDFAQDILGMDVIVGSAFKGRQTPVFAADMRYIVLQPYWDVPYSILVRELLPAIKANPNWVMDNGFEIVQGQGDDAIPQPATVRNVELLAAGTFRLRQRPGPTNSLGHVKFMFPNRHSVYLHDTPARSLFGRSRRAFSHGCIRVSDPMALLAHVMRGDPTWNAERLAAALQSTTPVRVALPSPIRVFIVYGTALATEAGETLFFDDIYDQDRRLTALLESRRMRATDASKRMVR